MAQTGRLPNHLPLSPQIKRQQGSLWSQMLYLTGTWLCQSGKGDKKWKDFTALSVPLLFALILVGRKWHFLNRVFFTELYANLVEFTSYDLRITSAIATSVLIFGEYNSFLWSHGYTYFELLVMSGLLQSLLQQLLSSNWRPITSNMHFITY